MVIELNEVDCSIVRWSKDGKTNWKSANIDDLIHDYERKIGRWIEEYNGNGWNDYWDYTCSVCEKTLKRGEPYPYCPNCGARMENEI